MTIAIRALTWKQSLLTARMLQTRRSAQDVMVIHRLAFTLTWTILSDKLWPWERCNRPRSNLLGNKLGLPDIFCFVQLPSPKHDEKCNRPFQQIQHSTLCCCHSTEVFLLFLSCPPVFVFPPSLCAYPRWPNPAGLRTTTEGHMAPIIELYHQYPHPLDGNAFSPKNLASRTCMFWKCSCVFWGPVAPDLVNNEARSYPAEVEVWNPQVCFETLPMCFENELLHTLGISTARSRSREKQEE